MGSAAEFAAMCKFLEEKKVSLEGLVDSVFKGLESADGAFEKMKSGSQFGKITGATTDDRKTCDYYFEGR
jgi:NADPH-dependent curcumin reductase CurA